METKLTSEILKEPFKTAFERKDTIDYTTKDCRDHEYVKDLGYTPSMNPDCSITACGLRSFSLSSYGDWGTFFVNWADEEEKQMFFDMVDKGIITLWRIRAYVHCGYNTSQYSYDDTTKEWRVYDSKEYMWKEAENPYVQNNGK